MHEIEWLIDLQNTLEKKRPISAFAGVKISFLLYGPGECQQKVSWFPIKLKTTGREKALFLESY